MRARTDVNFESTELMDIQTPGKGCKMPLSLAALSGPQLSLKWLKFDKNFDKDHAPAG
jgi:hypothetical protein